jgi:hypothetical protein
MKKITALLILFTSFSVFAQSPWTQEKGKFYTQLSFTTIPSYDALFGDPEYDTQRKTSDNTFQFYGEYGLSDKTTFIINLPLKLIETSDLNPNFTGTTSFVKGSESALGNIELGIRRQFYKKDWIISGQISVETNTGSFDLPSGIRTGYDAFTITPLILAGKGAGKMYYQAFLGANIRTNGYSSNFKVGGEIGRKITKKIWLIGFLDIVKSFENGDIVLPSSNLATGLYVNDQEYGSFGLKGIGEFTDKFGITAGFGGAFFGNNVAKQAALTFGLYHKF